MLRRRCRRRVGPYRCCSVIRGDSVKLMAALPPRSVHAVWTDPPYGHANQSGDLQAWLKSSSGRRLGRHFLGFEMAESYCRVARQRLAQEVTEPR